MTETRSKATQGAATPDLTTNVLHVSQILTKQACWRSGQHEKGLQSALPLENFFATHTAPHSMTHQGSTAPDLVAIVAAIGSKKVQRTGQQHAAGKVAATAMT